MLVASTLDPEYVRGLPSRCTHAGVTILDTPVSGGPAKAARRFDDDHGRRSGGGARARAHRCCAAIAGRRFAISDRVGDAAATKIVNNLLAGANLAAAAEALALAHALGLDVPRDRGRDRGELGRELDLRRPRAAQRSRATTRPRAAARILAKDVGIACDVARRVHVSAPFAEAARRAFVDTVDAGYGDDDDAAIIRRARERADKARDGGV